MPLDIVAAIRRVAVLLAFSASCVSQSDEQMLASKEQPHTLKSLRARLKNGPFPLPAPFHCAGFDEARELEIGGGGSRKVVVMSCNRNGVLALFRDDGVLATTYDTVGKPVLITVFGYDETGQALDELLVEEFTWGTGIVAKETVIYQFSDAQIAALWREPVWVRSDNVYVDGFVRLTRGEVGSHGPLLTYGRRESADRYYEEQVFEVGHTEVRLYLGSME